jgi:hypothetical protein
MMAEIMEDLRKQGSTEFTKFEHGPIIVPRPEIFGFAEL